MLKGLPYSILSNINFFRSNIKQAWRACIGKEQIIWIFWLKILELCILSISALSRQAWQACLVIKRWLKISELLAKLISFMSWCYVYESLAGGSSDEKEEFADLKTDDANALTKESDIM